MCGIAGYSGQRTIAESNVRACLELMQRRGPDSQAFFQHRLNPTSNVLLLHSRLNIIDLNDRSNQPFRLGSKTLVFNGEIYNYKELKNSLQKKGVSFTTESDTEVLAQLWTLHGEKALPQCEGMWAFAIYDRMTGELVLSRDRFGEKPLYFYQDETGFYFGSETKFITALLGRDLAVNRDQIYRYLINGYRSLYKQGDTFFENLQEVPSGSLLSLEANAGPSIRKRTYWTPRIQPKDSMSFEEAVLGTREHLIRSVELRLRADVPLAFCMSGGVDSNSLISIAKRTLGYDVHGFTIMNADPRYQERLTVGQVVQELQIRHTEVPLNTQGFLEKLPELIRQHDAPVYTISYYIQWLLMERIAQKGYKIAISGTGADELFSGYYDHHLAYFHDIQSDAALLKQSQNQWMEKIQPFVRNPFLKDPNLFIQRPGFREHLLLNADTFSTYLKQSWSETFTETPFTKDLLRNRMMNELFYEAVPVILHEDDLNAMYYSIENRSPFLDTPLFEFSGRIPTRHLIKEGMAKAVLREAMRGIVPECVLNSSHKIGFNAPITSLLNTQDPAIRGMLLEESPVFDLLRREAIAALLDKAEHPNSESKFLFNFINTKYFLEQHALPVAA